MVDAATVQVMVTAMENVLSVWHDAVEDNLINEQFATFDEWFNVYLNAVVDEMVNEIVNNDEELDYDYSQMGNDAMTVMFERLCEAMQANLQEITAESILVTEVFG
jgi:hypothetical protein